VKVVELRKNEEVTVERESEKEMAESGYGNGSLVHWNGHGAGT
jgi:hypothetical protein